MDTHIRRSEWLWVAWITLALIALSSVPIFIAWAATPQDAHFAGFVSNPMDQQSYIAKMRQGWNGAWRYRLAYTPEPTDGVPVYLLYLFLGQLSRLAQVPLLWTYHGIRVLASALLIPVCYRFAAQVCQDVPERRLATLLIGFGHDQVGDGFGAGEVELAVLEGATSEFARLGQAAEAQLADGGERRADHRAAAMQMQLGHHLAGLGVGRLEPHHQTAIDLLAGQRVDQRAHHHAARLG